MRRAFRLAADERGGTTTEYALIAGLIALMTITGVKVADLTFDLRAEQLAAAQKEPAVAAARSPGEEIITGSIRRRAE